MAATIQAIHPVLAAAQVEDAVQFFARLGFVCVFRDAPEVPRYAVMRRGSIELHLQWADDGQWVAGVDRPAYRFLVDDVDALFREFTASGAVDPHVPGDSPWAAPADTPWGTREFHLRDLAMHSLQFYRPR